MGLSAAGRRLKGDGEAGTSPSTAPACPGDEVMGLGGGYGAAAGGDGGTRAKAALLGSALGGDGGTDGPGRHPWGGVGGLEKGL